jgi:hypothetical protein
MLNDCLFQIKPKQSIIEIIQLPNNHSENKIMYSFDSKQTQTISIGRDKSCNIKLDWDKSYSKFQTMIIWDSSMEKWKIIDGGVKGLSRNGSWLIASKSQELKHGTIIMVVNTKIEVSIKN